MVIDLKHSRCMVSDENNFMGHLMDNRELLTLFEMLHNEERQRIIQALLSADNKGLSQNELAESTFLPETEILKHLDYLMATNLLKSQLKGPKKNFYANRELLDDLLKFMNENRGKGLHQVEA